MAYSHIFFIKVNFLLFNFSKINRGGNAKSIDFSFFHCEIIILVMATFLYLDMLR